MWYYKGTTSLYKGSHYGYPLFYCIIIFVPYFKLILYSKSRSYERGYFFTEVYTLNINRVSILPYIS